ncbi:hypothetical protein [Streptomyces sp. SAS_276]|uniref:hypothetical protein n=1 Tax=Streptomyces sp. SAS_276 TaxID=3412745 RepID=UPI00403C4569
MTPRSASSARLLLGEHLQRHFRDQVEPVAPAPGGQPALSGQHDLDIRRQDAVDVAERDVTQPLVQHRAGPLVHVEEQHHPRAPPCRLRQVLQEHRGERAHRVHHKPNVVVGSQPAAQRGPQPVRALGDLLWIDGTGERPHDRDHAEAGQTHLRGDRGRERGPGRLRGADALRDRLGLPGRLRFVLALAEGDHQFVEATQLQTLKAEPVADLRHRFHGAVHAVVEIYRGRALFAGDRLPLPQQRGLAHTGIAPYMEEELVVVA